MNNDPKNIPNVCFSLMQTLDDCGDEETYKRFENQRIKNGFDESELWNLNRTIILFVYPRLKEFKNLNKGWHPKCFSEKEWESALDTVISAMQEIVEYDEKEHDMPLDGDNHLQKAMELFGKILLYLWD